MTIMRGYDVHFHAFNFTHVNFTAFLQRHMGAVEDLQRYANNPWVMNLLPAILPLGAVLYKDKIEKAAGMLDQVDNFVNLGFILSQDLDTYLDHIEAEVEAFLPSAHLAKGNKKVDRLTLVPLIMDFTDPSFTNRLALKYGYSGKEVVKQTTDLLRAIKKRCQNSERKVDYLPFLGLNPFNYSLDNDVSIYTRLKLEFKPLMEMQKGKLSYDAQSTLLVWRGGTMDAALVKRLVAHSRILDEEGFAMNARENKRLRELIFSRLSKHAERQNAGESPKLGELLEQYFGDYDPQNEAAFYKNQSKFSSLEETGSNVFGGIKFYPPLGFDPWPDYEGIAEGENVALKKVKLLYAFCEAKQIPITVHCSDGGFKTMPEHLHLLFTSPARWRKVLENYPKLKINFAHCGVQNADMRQGHEWKGIIFREFMLEKQYPNVFADVSDLLSTKEGYVHFKEGMQDLNLSAEEHKEIGRRLLFGTDFMVSLREGNSYREYLELFEKDTSVFKTWWNKERVCCENGRRFLFGGP